MAITNQRIKTFLAQYCPGILPFAGRCLHTARFGPYEIEMLHTSLTDASFAEKLRWAIAEHNEGRKARPKNEIHLLLYTHGLTSGGAERQWCYLAVELARRGYAVTLLTDSLDGDAGHYLPLLQDSNVRILTIDNLLIPEDLATQIPALGIPLHVYRCMAAFALLRPSHVLCQLDGGNIYGGSAAFLVPNGPEKLLLSFRNVNPSHFPHHYQPWMLPLYKALAESRDIILSGNSKYGNDDHADWLELPRERVVTMNNALHMPEVSQDRKEEIRQKLSISSDALVILSVFRLAPEKNPLLMLNVISQLRDSFPLLVVLHAGVGDLADITFEEAQRLGLGDTIRFLGRRQDVFSLMQSADLFLLTSNFEGIPNVLLEAQTACLPIVATAVGGVPEAVIAGETALLAPKGDRQTLVRHCRVLLEDAELRNRMGDAGKKFVTQHFSHETLGDRTLDALGLPREPQKNFKGAFEELPVCGILADNAYCLSLIMDYLSSHAEPVAIFFGEEAGWEQYLPLPKGSLYIVPNKSTYGGTSSHFVFDWVDAPSWQPLREVISGIKTAVFSTNICLYPVFRSRLHKLGIKHIIFCNAGMIYHIPVLCPPFYKRFVPMMKYIFKS